MTEESRKLEHFTSTILEDAQNQRREIELAAQELFNARVNAAEQDIIQKMTRYQDVEIAKIKSDSGKEASRRLLDGKRSLFVKRGEIAIKIAADLRSRLNAWTATDKYQTWLAASLERCIKKLDCGNREVVVRCREVDLPCVIEIMDRLRPDNYATEIAPYKIGGVCVICPDENMLTDDTLDCAFEDTKDHIAEYIGLRLE